MTYISSQKALFLGRVNIDLRTRLEGTVSSACVDLTMFIDAAINRGELKIKNNLQR